MTPRAHVVIAAVLLGCVCFIFVSPFLNLPWTALQASRNGAARFLIPLAMLGCVGFLFASLRLLVSAWQLPWVPALQSDSLIDLTCTRRC